MGIKEMSFSNLRKLMETSNVYFKVLSALMIISMVNYVKDFAFDQDIILQLVSLPFLHGNIFSVSDKTLRRVLRLKAFCK